MRAYACVCHRYKSSPQCLFAFLRRTYWLSTIFTPSPFKCAFCFLFVAHSTDPFHNRFMFFIWFTDTNVKCGLAENIATWQVPFSHHIVISPAHTFPFWSQQEFIHWIIFRLKVQYFGAEKGWRRITLQECSNVFHVVNNLYQTKSNGSNESNKISF